MSFISPRPLKRITKSVSLQYRAHLLSSPTLIPHTLRYCPTTRQIGSPIISGTHKASLEHIKLRAQAGCLSIYSGLFAAADSLQQLAPSCPTSSPSPTQHHLYNFEANTLLAMPQFDRNTGLSRPIPTPSQPTSISYLPAELDRLRISSSSSNVGHSRGRGPLYRSTHTLSLPAIRGAYTAMRGAYTAIRGAYTVAQHGGPAANTDLREPTVPIMETTALAGYTQLTISQQGIPVLFVQSNAPLTIHAGPGGPLHRPKGDRPADDCEFKRVVQMGKWDYGPALDRICASAVHASPTINPLLQYSQDSSTTGHHSINWNMLFPSSYATATATSQETLLARLREPATHPRLSAIRVISRAFPWTIEIHAQTRLNTALTCQDILDQLHLFFYKFLLRREMHTATPEHQKATWIYHKANRTPADGLRARVLNNMYTGMRKIEWLGKDTAFRGIEQDDEYVRQQVGVVIPGTYVLICGHPVEAEASA
ncbi:hypothetical protein PLICRDRAFT_566537 [Plicaturopsis crispa FD-325 SS-3]|nr:hypothetical protein PLICRDRAFT_566537 [Plicaturopsis crispa FD-325 SS-3]